MINGAHCIIYSKDADADRAFFRDVLRLPHVDVGDGWLIFALPPSEVAFHPTGGDPHHQLHLMCEDVEELVARLKEKGVDASPIASQGWGLSTTITLPGGGELGVYQPRHQRPQASGG